MSAYVMYVMVVEVCVHVCTCSECVGLCVYSAHMYSHVYVPCTYVYACICTLHICLRRYVYSAHICSHVCVPFPIRMYVYPYPANNNVYACSYLRSTRWKPLMRLPTLLMAASRYTYVYISICTYMLYMYIHTHGCQHCQRPPQGVYTYTYLCIHI